jgi:cytochrome c oxidase assembly protein subunit 15
MCGIGLLIVQFMRPIMISDHAAVHRFLYLSFVSLGLIFILMLIGTYVDASHQGLSCPDWPLCPNGFGFPSKKYFFEEIHRIVAVITASTVFATAAYASRRGRFLRKSTVAATLIVAVQILLGMFVVHTRLEPLLVATHLSTGVLLFGTALITFLSAYRTTPMSTQNQ